MNDHQNQQKAPDLLPSLRPVLRPVWRLKLGRPVVSGPPWHLVHASDMRALPPQLARLAARLNQLVGSVSSCDLLAAASRR